MKKILSIILCLSMLLSCVALTAGAADNELIIDVVTDIHMDQDSGKPITKRNNLSETFSHVAAAGMLYSESKAVIAAFLDEAAKDKSEVVLVPGDLADTGFYQEMVAVRDMFSAFENSTGKQIYVVPGNHDVSRTDANQFMTVLADFGYNEAIARDENSASYVADLPMLRTFPTVTDLLLLTALLQAQASTVLMQKEQNGSVNRLPRLRRTAKRQ